MNEMVLHILRKPDNDYLTRKCLRVVMYDIVDHHPGLAFLQNQKLFQRLYVETVIIRIFFEKANSCTEKFTLKEMKKYQLAEKLDMLNQEPDINAVRNFRVTVRCVMYFLTSTFL